MEYSWKKGTQLSSRGPRGGQIGSVKLRLKIAGSAKIPLARRSPGVNARRELKQELPAIVMEDIHDHQIVAHREHEVTVVLGMSEIG